MADTLSALRVRGVAVGGDGLAHDTAGRVVLIAGALPGELVRVAVVEERPRVAHAVVTEVVEPSPDRVEPPCPYDRAGCGGCGWQHVAPAAQPGLKAAMVADALARLGGIDAPVVDPGPSLPAAGYRTTVRGVAGEDGRVGLRRRGSHELVAVPGCQVAHPLVVEVLAAGRFPPGAAVTVRAGARTGERLVLVDPAVGDSAAPEGVRLVGADELAGGRRAWFHEEVAGRRFRVSALSFFQPQPAGAEALIGLVAGAVAAGAGEDPPGHLVDLYGGVGLFGGSLPAERVTLVESSPSACADARVNLAERHARVVRSDVVRWHARRADAVVADPPRAGLGRQGVRVVGATGAARVVLVSCDAGSLGRDAALLGKAGYDWRGSTVVDQFGATPHVEVVTRFDRR